MDETATRVMTAEDAMGEIWSELCADCGPGNYEFMVEQIRKMNRFLHKVAPAAPGELPDWLKA